MISTSLILVGLLAVPFIWGSVKLNKLKATAAIAAALIAIIVTFKAASLVPLLPLLFFFCSSIVLEYLLSSNAKSDAKDRKARDVMQVIANGGIYGIVYLFAPFLIQDIVGIDQTSEVVSSLYETDKTTLIISRFLMGMGLVSLAVATADTWAGIIGKYFKKTAFDPFRWTAVEAGLSGGISLAGTIGALIGSMSIASFLYVLLPHWKLTIPHFAMITIAGFGGMLLDSFLGSRLQKQYFYDDQWHDSFEEGQLIVKERGLAWMTNDMVNLVANLVVCIALGIIFVLR